MLHAYAMLLFFVCQKQASEHMDSHWILKKGGGTAMVNARAP